jgi:multiple sugar transport system ATP-binding protein
MSAGVLQQVGPPQELYERPVNKFVAGFIGSPSMNFIDVEANREGGRLTVKNENVELAVPQRLTAALDGAEGGLTLGIRPEHFEIANGAAQEGHASIRATTDVVEFLGNEELLHVRVGDHDLVAIVDASHRVRPGDVLEMTVPVDKIHLFKDDGQAIA